VLELEPGGDVGVVVEPGDDDLVSLLQLAGQSSGEREVEVGHARSEDRLVRLASEKARRGVPCLCDQLTRSPARLELAADVGVRFAEVPGDGLDHLVGNLRPCRPVEEGIGTLERREPGSDSLDVERYPHQTRPSAAPVLSPPRYHA
jgi:hypothetical protein